MSDPRCRLHPPGRGVDRVNFYDACPACEGIGERFEVGETTLVPDPSKPTRDDAVRDPTG